MCGLVFMVQKDNRIKEPLRKELFTQLLYASALRGDDACGVYATSWDGEVEAIYKRALPSADFINTPGYFKVMASLDRYNVVMGHTRKATYETSAMSDAHAHPFAKGHIVMSHNGHLSNPYSLPKTANPVMDLEQTTVDSDMLARSISDAGYAAALRAANGAWALNWFDKNEKTFYITRNDQRPLFFGHVEDLDIILGGSELSMLEWVLARNGQQFKKDKVFAVANPTVGKKTGEWANIVKWTEKTFPAFEREQVMLSTPRKEKDWSMTGPPRVVDTSTGEIVEGPADGGTRKQQGGKKETTGTTGRTGSDTTETKLSRAKVEQQLQALGLHSGMEVDVGIDLLSPYDKSAKLPSVVSSGSHSILGRAFGIMKHETMSSVGKLIVYYPCVIHGMDLTKIDMTHLYKGAVHGSYWDEESEEYVVVLQRMEATTRVVNPLKTLAACAETMRGFRARAADIGAILRNKSNVVSINRGTVDSKKAHAPTGRPTTH